MLGLEVHPVILGSKPSVAGGDEAIEPVQVEAGALIVDREEVLTNLEEGVPYMPVGCRDGGCAQTYNGDEPVSKDQMMVRFKLSPGIQWSDGETLSASDSVYSYEIAKELYTRVRPALIRFTHSYLTSVFRSLKSEPFNSEISIYLNGKPVVDKLTDRELVLQLQGGSLEALGALYDRHSRWVYRTALVVTGDPEAASDLLRHVFLRLYHFVDRVDPERPLESWLYRVTANQAYTWVKHHQRWSPRIEKSSRTGWSTSLGNGL